MTGRLPDERPPRRDRHARRGLLARALLAVAAAVLAAVAPVDAAASEPRRDYGGAYMLHGTKAEQAALQSSDSAKYIRARKEAEAILETAPDSLIATWVLAEVFHEEEANHARALFYTHKAKRLLAAAYGHAPTDAQAQIWHKRILTKEIWLLGEMDRKAEQLDVIDEYDALYAPKLTRLRIWPLMKLRRYDEAEAVGRSLIRSTDYHERVSAYNGLMAIADERLDRVASYDWGKAGIENAQGRSCILFHNTSQAALARFRFAEAEELARKAIRAERRDCPNSSYEHLATLYLIAGEFQKTISALERLNRAPVDRRYRTQFAMGNRAQIVDLLYALGRGEDALAFAEQVFEAPDRTGMTSVSKDEIRFAHAVSLWQALELRAQQLLDRASVRGFFASADDLLAARAIRLRQWELSRVALRLALTKDILVTGVRPYLRGVKPWYAGNLAPLVGTGLIRAARDLAESLDAPMVAQEARGYYAALAGELAWRAGEPDAAISWGEVALEALPPEMRLLRWRTQAWFGALLWRGGERGAALGHLREVLHRLPSALMHLDLRVPVAIHHDGAPLSVEVAERLGGSRRLDAGADDGFRVDVSMGDAELAVCLATRDGFRFGCARSPVDRAGEDDVVAACDAFHTELFTPKVALTSSDINSLDGSTVRVNAEQVLEGLLGKPKRGEEDEL